jgi:hypothetical protein
MTAQKRLLSIVAIVCLSTMTASALNISVSIGKHGHAHGRKPVVIASRHRHHSGTAIIHMPHSRRVIYESMGARPYVRLLPIRRHTSGWKHPHTVVRRPCTKRSILVAPPRHSVRRPACGSTLTIWISNSNGSKTPVKLQRKGAGYVGPKGEYYTSRPSHRQLHMIYGF